MVHYILKYLDRPCSIEIENLNKELVSALFQDGHKMIYVLKNNVLKGVIGETELSKMKKTGCVVYNTHFTSFVDEPDVEKKIIDCFNKHMNWKGIPVVSKKGELIREYYFDQKEYYENLTIEKGEGINHSQRDERIIVSLTSHGIRLQTVFLTIKSLMHQTMKADAIELYLDDDTGYDSIQQEEYVKTRGASVVRGVENLRCYVKYYYAMKDHEDEIIITVDDDFFYDDTLIEDLYMAHIQYPEAVICRYGERIKYSDGKPFPYIEWNDATKSVNVERDICVKGFAGVLYPAGKYRKKLLDKEAFQRLSLFNDDLWITACLQELDVPVFTLGEMPISMIESTQSIALWNTESTPIRNDKYVNNLREYFHKAFRN